MDTPSDFQNSVPGAPPPPPEVKVRTMRSDLESMARSGGGAPQFLNVAVAGLGGPSQASDAAPSQGAAENTGQQAAASGEPSKSMIGPILVVIVALVALGVVGYFAYTILYAPAAIQPPVPGTATSTTP